MFTPANLALLSDWLDETGELYIDVYQPHGGASSFDYFIRSMNDLKLLVSQQTYPEIVFTVFRYLQYSLRGVADESLLKQALHEIPDGQWYTIVSLDNVYPSMVSWWGSGNSHKELQNEFAEVYGKRVGIGQNPFDIHSGNWFRLHPDEVLEISILSTSPIHG
jgi:hypothetical protein